MIFSKSHFSTARCGLAALLWGASSFLGAARAQTPTPTPSPRPTTPPTLSFRVAQSTLDEGQSTTTIVSRTGSTATAAIVTLSSFQPAQLSVPASVTIPAGSTSATFRVQAIDNELADAGNRVLFGGGATGYRSSPIAIFVRNTTPLAVTLESQRTTVRENDGGFIITLRRNFAFQNAVTVFLAGTAPSRLEVPEKVVFAANQATVSVRANVINNQIVDGDARVTISVSKPNTPISDSLIITIQDDEVPELRVSVEPQTFGEGDGPNAAVGTVTRNTNPASGMTVTLASSDPGRVTVPARVVIPAGSSSATFPVGAVDDDGRGNTNSVTISAIKNGLKSGNFVVFVFDDETNLSLRIAPATISEADGATAATGTVRRGGDLSQELVVTLSRSNVLVLPETVTIAAGSREATFAIGVVDDQTSSGPRRLQVSASAENFVTAYSTLTVLDDDRTVELRLGNTVFYEANGGNATNASVLLSEPASADVIVPLSADKPGQLSFPSSVTIPRGRQVASFVVRAVDDSEDDGLQTVTITASAEGFRSDSVVVNVFDNDGGNDSPRLTLEISPTTFSENAGFEAAVGTVRRNTLTGSGMTVTLVSSDSSSAQVPPTVTIPAGSAEASFRITAVDNDLADGTRTVRISAIKAGLEADQVDVTITDDEGGTAPASTRANAKLSSAQADAARGEINLNFTGRIDANLASDGARYAVEINGARVAIERIAVNQSTSSVRLQLPEGTLNSGNRVRVWWALGEPDQWRSVLVIAR